MPSLLEEDHRESPPREDSIQEVASILLDDTTIDQLNADTYPGRRLSQAAAAGVYNYGRRVEKEDNKALPPIPNFMFNGDDAWAQRPASVVTAAGNLNKFNFNSDTEPSIGHPSTQTHHTRRDSAPKIPRKSSLRKAGRLYKQSKGGSRTIDRKEVAR